MRFCGPDCTALCNHCARCNIKHSTLTCTVTGEEVEPKGFCHHFYCTLAGGSSTLKLERWATQWLDWDDEDIKKELAPWPKK